MSELAMEVEDMFYEGASVKEIANRLGLPASMIKPMIKELRKANEVSNQDGDINEKV
jgi:transposase